MKHLFLYLLLTVIIVGCSSDDTVSPISDAGKVPGVGSTFDFDFYFVDSANNPVSDIATKGQYTVTATNATMVNRSGVWSLMGSFTSSSSNASNRDTSVSHFCCDSQNDVLLNAEFISDKRLWLRLPVSTGIASKDSARFESRSGKTVMSMITSKLIGQETVLINGTSVPTVKLELKTTETLTSGAHQVSTAMIWWAPSLGMFVKTVNSSDQAAGSYVSEMQRYTLR